MNNTEQTTTTQDVNNNVNTTITPTQIAQAASIDPTLNSGAVRTNNPIAYQAGTTENIKAVPIVPGPAKLLLKSKDKFSVSINNYYNKFFVYDALCPKCKKYYFRVSQPDNLKVRCPNCLEDHLISEFKETKTQFNLELSEKLLFAGLAVIIIGFFLYVDQFTKFFSMICLGLIMCIPKLKLEFDFDRKKCLYAALVLFILPLLVSLLVK